MLSHVFNVFPKGIPNNTTLLSHMVCPKFFPSLIYRWAYIWAKHKALHLHMETSILRTFKSFKDLFFFGFFWANQNGSLDPKKKSKKKGNLGDTSHLFNKIMILCCVLYYLVLRSPKVQIFWSYGQFSIEALFWPPTPFKKKNPNSLPLDPPNYIHAIVC